MLYHLRDIRYTTASSEWATTRISCCGRVQPAMVGLIDGSLSTLAPIFGIAFYTHRPHAALVAGLATAIGAAIRWPTARGCPTPGS